MDYLQNYFFLDSAESEASIKCIYNPWHGSYHAQQLFSFIEKFLISGWF